jgi:hypothetical protein
MYSVKYNVFIAILLEGMSHGENVAENLVKESLHQQCCVKEQCTESGKILNKGSVLDKNKIQKRYKLKTKWNILAL